MSTQFCHCALTHEQADIARGMHCPDCGGWRAADIPVREPGPVRTLGRRGPAQDPAVPRLGFWDDPSSASW